MKKKVLLQIDHDEHASSFDSLVAIDSSVDHLLTYSSVTPIQIQPIIHGAIFTRGSKDLNNTAAFFGGSDVGRSIELFEQTRKCFFGPLRISMMSDPNGSNTTAAAAVLCAMQHTDLKDKHVTVLAGTGPVGQRISRLVASAGAKVTVCSRRMNRAQQVCDHIEKQTGIAAIPREAAVPATAAAATEESEIVFAAGAAGIQLLDESWLESNQSAELVLDINAVPPVGIAGIESMDKGESRHSKICYGAIGIGQLKMKIHKRCIAALFESNEHSLGTDEIFQIGEQLISES